MSSRIQSWINGYQRLGGSQGSVRATRLRPDRDGPPGPAPWMRPNTPQFRATMPQAPAPALAPASVEPPPPEPPPAPPPWWTTERYIRGIGSLNQQRDDAIGGLWGDLQALGKNTGYGVNLGPLDDADPSNDSTAITADTSNPFSRLNLLKQSYDQAQRGTNTSMAARGQLYSGAIQRQREHNVNQNQQQEHFIRSDFEDAMRGFINARQSVRNQHTTQSNTLIDDIIKSQQNTLPDDPGPPVALFKTGEGPSGAIGPARSLPGANFVKGEPGAAQVNRSGGPGQGSKHGVPQGFEMAALAYQRRTGRPLTVQEFLRGVR